MKKVYYSCYLLFYQLLRVISFVRNDIIEWSAIFALSILVGINIITALIIIILFFPQLSFLATGGAATSLMLCILAINYFLFIKNKRYQKIIKDKEVNNAISYSITYIIISILAAVLFIGKGREKNLRLKKMKDVPQLPHSSILSSPPLCLKF